MVRTQDADSSFEHEPLEKTRWPYRSRAAFKANHRAGLKIKTVKPHQQKRVNVDTKVQGKDVRLPLDALAQVERIAQNQSMPLWIWAFSELTTYGCEGFVNWLHFDSGCGTVRDYD